MIFYMCDIRIKNFVFPEDNDERMIKIQDLNQKINGVNSQEKAHYQVFLYYAKNYNARFYFAVRKNEVCDSTCESKEETSPECGLQDIVNFFKELVMDGDIFIVETTKEIFVENLRKCKGVQHFYDHELILTLGGEEYLCGKCDTPIKYANYKSKIITEAHNLLVAKTLVPEIERIYQGGNSASNGHPVHYIIRCDDLDKCEVIANLLIVALHVNNRLKSKNSFTLRIDGKYWTHDDHLKILRFLSGGVAGVICHKEQYNRENCDDTIKEMCAMLDKYNQDILFIFMMPENSKTAKKLIHQNSCGATFVTIEEETLTGFSDFLFDNDVHCYLDKMAEAANAEPAHDLYDTIETDREYAEKEIKRVFSRWNNNRLKNQVYPQYAELEAVDEPEEYEELEEDNDSAYNELVSMIGLTEPKAVIQQALNFHKAQALFRENGIEQAYPSMHMIFTGSPGVAKSSVARLFANILKENGLIENSLVEVSRADLVGRYVGHTAPLVKQAFERAQGGILFIDEAYSLVDSRENSFGDEAISAIVKEMEDNRNKVIVIFAGYQDKMEDFLNRNPGLRSRINFHVPFSDYDIDELYAIAELTAKKQGLTLADNVKDKLIPILTDAIKQINFGNGRFVRTLIEKARLKQAGRLVKIDPAKLCKADFILTAEDFEMPAEKQEMRRIGFLPM